MADRDPLTDPQPGDRFHAPTFAGGATCTVTRRAWKGAHSVAMLGFDAVSVRWEADNGRKVEARGRVYAVVGFATQFRLEYLPP